MSSRYSDSGVVTRMCGGVLQHRRALVLRRVAAAHGRGDLRTGAKPVSSAIARISRRGSARFLWMSADSAFSGET